MRALTLGAPQALSTTAQGRIFVLVLAFVHFEDEEDDEDTEDWRLIYTVANRALF